MSENLAPQRREFGTAKAYYVGLVLSLGCTFLAYYIATQHWFTAIVSDSLIGLLALLQAGAQLLLFFHLKSESKPHWNWITFFFALMVVVILVVGSIWIMNNLMYNL